MSSFCSTNLKNEQAIIRHCLKEEIIWYCLNSFYIENLCTTSAKIPDMEKKWCLKLKPDVQ